MPRKINSCCMFLMPSSFSSRPHTAACVSSATAHRRRGERSGSFNLLSGEAACIYKLSTFQTLGVLLCQSSAQELNQAKQTQREKKAAEAAEAARAKAAAEASVTPWWRSTPALRKSRFWSAAFVTALDCSSWPRNLRMLGSQRL